MQYSQVSFRRRHFLLYFSDISISDPSFRSNESSWMSFAPFYIRHKTHIKLQFQPLSPDGILFYTAQHLGTQSGKDIPSLLILYIQVLW